MQNDPRQTYLLFISDSFKAKFITYTKSQLFERVKINVYI